MQHAVRALLALLCAVQPAAAQVDFAMDFSAAAVPHAGWRSAGGAMRRLDNGLWAFNHSTTGGPSAAFPNYYELVQVASSNPGAGNGYGGQFGWGWEGGAFGPVPSFGEKRYIGLYVYFPNDNNGKALNWPDGERVRMTVKWVITGNGNRDRFIPGYELRASSPSKVRFLAAIDGGDALGETEFTYALGTWHCVQYEWTYSSARGAADASWKMWVDVDSYASPTLARAGHVMNPAANSNSVGLGYFPNMGLDPNGGVHKQRLARFQWSRSFDPTWCGAMRAGAPLREPRADRPMRDGLRVGPGLLFVGLGGFLASVALRRRRARTSVRTGGKQPIRDDRRPVLG